MLHIILHQSLSYPKIGRPLISHYFDKRDLQRISRTKQRISHVTLPALQLISQVTLPALMDLNVTIENKINVDSGSKIEKVYFIYHFNVILNIDRRLVYRLRASTW